MRGLPIADRFGTAGGLGDSIRRSNFDEAGRSYLVCDIAPKVGSYFPKSTHDASG